MVSINVVGHFAIFLSMSDPVAKLFVIIVPMIHGDNRITLNKGERIMRLLCKLVAVVFFMSSVIVSCSDPERQRLIEAEDLYNQSKLTEALRLVQKVQTSGKHQDDALLLITKICKNNLVVTSDPSGLEVFLAPVSALGELTKESDNKTELAVSFGEVGVPRAIGCKDFSVGMTPIVLAKPDKNSIISVLRKYQKGNAVDKKRTFTGDITIVGKPSFTFNVSEGFFPLNTTIVLWDNEERKAGQIQLLSSGELIALSTFRHYEDHISLVDFSFTPESLYKSLADKSLSIQLIED